MQYPNINQRRQTTIQGAMDLQYQGSSISVRLDSTTAGDVLPGTPVKLVNDAGPEIEVVECAADTDHVFGFVQYDPKKANFDAGDMMEIALVNGGKCMWMTASAAIAKGAAVMVVISGVKVATATTNKTQVGICLTKAAADLDLVRVLMLPGKILAV